MQEPTRAICRIGSQKNGQAINNSSHLWHSEFVTWIVIFRIPYQRARRNPPDIHSALGVWVENITSFAGNSRCCRVFRLARIPRGVATITFRQFTLTLFTRKSLTILLNHALFFGSIIIAAISLINIFIFSNRVLQMRICRINLFLVFALIGMTVYFLIGIPSIAIEKPGIGLAMPLFALIFSFLGLKKIGADEKIVRSMDRLR